MNINLLNEKINPDAIKSRMQNGKKLSYIEGYFAENNANRIFDYNWSKELISMDKLFDRTYTKDGKEMYEIAYKSTVRVHIGELEIYRDGTGFGNGSSSVLSGAYELAIKEAETDAMKRALKSLGNQFGIELYDKAYDPKENYKEGVTKSAELYEMRDKIKECKTMPELTEIYKNYKGSYKKEVEKALSERRKELT